VLSSVGDLWPDVERTYARETLACRPFEFLGLPVRLYSNGQTALSLLEASYEEFLSESASSADVASMYVIETESNEGRRYEMVDPGFDAFVSDDVSQAVACWGAQLMGNHLFRQRFLFVHGSVLAGPEGGVWIFFGASQAGKTTLAFKLLAHGHAFYSDEFAPISVDTGLIHPFPRSLFLRRTERVPVPVPDAVLDACPAFDDHQDARAQEAPPRRTIVPPARLPGVNIARHAAEPAALYVLDGFSEGPTKVRPTTPPYALKFVLDNATNPSYLDAESKRLALETVVGLLKTTPCFSVTLGPASERPEVLADVFKRARAAWVRPPTEELDRLAARCRALLEVDT